LTRKVSIGKIGKPHGLKGYAYVHLNEYIKSFDFKDMQVKISGEHLYIYEVKKHLKNRNLIKLKKIDTIDQVNIYRNQNILANTKNFIDLNIDLPWPEILLNESIANNDNSQITLVNYHVSNLQTVLEIKVANLTYLVPYVVSNFIFENESLIMVNSLTVYNPVE
tara:strand:+ start:2324 stop:2818 length:495 start_codon:yes stop_codon:yes gene_type:complete